VYPIGLKVVTVDLFAASESQDSSLSVYHSHTQHVLFDVPPSSVEVGSHQRIVMSSKSRYKSGYSKEQLDTAVETAFSNTSRLRCESGGVWSTKMAKVVSQVASQFSIPLQTLKGHVVKRMTENASGTQQHSTPKNRTDERGIMKATEMKVLYEWIEFMRRRYSPPTRKELRGQAADILLARGVIRVPSEAWVTRFVAYCRNHFATDDPKRAIIQRVPRTQD